MRFFTLAVSGIQICLASAALAVEVPGDTGPQSSDTGAGSFTELIRRIRDENPAVQAAQAAVEAARAGRVAADQPLHNPVLELEGENAADTTAFVGLNQTIDWGDRRGARTSIAGFELVVAEANLTLVRRRVAAEVLTALARYQTARDLHKLSRRRVRQMEDLAETAEQRYQSGDLGRLDAALGKTAHAEARIRQTHANTALIAAEAALRSVSGLARTEWPSLPEELPVPPTPVDIEALLAGLPELVARQRQIDAARGRIDLARRERVSEPTIGVRAGREGDDSLIGLRLEIPLMVRNPFRAEVQIASQQALQMEQEYLDAYRRARARLEGALANYRSTAAGWVAWQETGQSALTEQVALLERLWKAGELSAMEYLFQAKQNVETQETATKLAGDLWLAVFDWLDASGRIDSWLEAQPAHSR